MATVVSFNGGSFTIPAIGEEDWGGNNKVDGFLIAVANNALSKSGGTFSLTSEVDFGGLFGQKCLYYKSRGTNVATSGIVRLANAEGIAWRNAANSQNLVFTVNASDQLEFNGKPLMSPSGYVFANSGGTGFSSYSVGDFLYADTTTTLAKLGIGTQNQVIISSGSVPQWSLITNSNIDASASIARSKLATGSASHVIINDGNGALSSEASLSVTRGGTGASTLTGYVKGNGTNSFTASSTVPRNEIASGTAGQVVINDGSGVLSSEAQLSKARGGCGADMSAVTFPTTGTIVTASGTQTLSNKTIQKRIVNLVDAATISLDASLGDVYRVTLAGNRTLANPTNLVDGQTIQIQVKQDATGTRTLNYDTVYRFSLDLPKPTLSTVPGMIDRLLFEYRSTENKLDLIAVNKGYLL